MDSNSIRERAVHNYLATCDTLTEQGDRVYNTNSEAAFLLWERAMLALDAAIEAAKGLKLNDNLEAP